MTIVRAREAQYRPVQKKILRNSGVGDFFSFSNGPRRSKTYLLLALSYHSRDYKLLNCVLARQRRLEKSCVWRHRSEPATSALDVLNYIITNRPLAAYSEMPNMYGLYRVLLALIMQHYTTIIRRNHGAILPDVRAQS